MAQRECPIIIVIIAALSVLCDLHFLGAAFICPSREYLKLQEGEVRAGPPKTPELGLPSR
jgi:hypothetical protein